MNRNCKKYLRLAAKPAGHSDTAGDWASIGQLAKLGLVTVSERLVAIKNLGVAPVPHITITEQGRVYLRSDG